jgi:hypothetical protein
MADNDKTPETLEDALARIEALNETVKTVRAEAAKARVDKRTAAADAKNEAQAEFDAKLEEMRKQQDEVGVELNKSRLTIAQMNAALNAVVPDVKDRVVEIAGRLIGSSDDELAKDADRVKSLFGLDTQPRTPAVDPSQGHGNQNELPLNGDPLLNAMMGVLNKKNR